MAVPSPPGQLRIAQVAVRADGWHRHPRKQFADSVALLDDPGAAVVDVVEHRFEQRGSGRGGQVHAGRAAAVHGIVDG
jgi:hypothetical protein